MTQEKAIRQRKKFAAVLFDCDGVLVDSEPIVNRLLRDMMQELGWKLTLQQSMDIFLGRLVSDRLDLIEAHITQPLPPGWPQAWLSHFRDRRDEKLERELLAVPGIHEALRTIGTHYEDKLACASGADRRKVMLQLSKVGLLSPYFEGRIFSGHEMPRSKPAPDVYLAAAAALCVDPRQCAVIEDSVTGVTAGVAAGATVFAYAPPENVHAQPEALLAAGAVRTFEHMGSLSALLLHPISV